LARCLEYDVFLNILDLDMDNSLITARGIERTFGKEGGVITHVLKGIDLNIARGEFVAIMGKSGAGKSTLLYQLSLLDTPSAGTLTVNTIDVLALDESKKTSFRLNTLGFIFQDYALIPDLTARENVMLPLLMRGNSWSQASAASDDALTKVGLAHRLNNHPSALSGGEQQRVSIARAVAGNPAILFADEPTANLDSISGRQVIDLLGDLHTSGQTIVMVTHEEEYAAGCDRIIRMEDGKIITKRDSTLDGRIPQ
jgi:putative ABC transport system ATP-binding protein